MVTRLPRHSAVAPGNVGRARPERGSLKIKARCCLSRALIGWQSTGKGSLGSERRTRDQLSEWAETEIVFETFFAPAGHTVYVWVVVVPSVQPNGSESEPLAPYVP